MQSVGKTLTDFLRSAAAGEWNKADNESKHMADPKIFDPHLTTKGEQQSRALREKLSDLIKLHGSPLWVTSPLTRCIQTMLGACPYAEQLGNPLKPAGAASVGTSDKENDPCGGASSSAAAGSKQQQQHKVVMLGTIAEHCQTTGDVGRPGPQLAAEFPQFAEQFSTLKDVWWYSEANKTNCAVSKSFKSLESRDHMRRRTREFKTWLYNRPEKFIVCFGHSTFWKYFMDSKDRLKNGELKQMQF